MAQCVVVDGSGALVASVSDPCTGFVALTPAEYGALQSPFNLSPEDGAAVSAAVAGVWVIAWAGRALYAALRVDDTSPE